VFLREDLSPLLSPQSCQPLKGLPSSAPQACVSPPDLARRYPFTELLTEDFEGLWKTMRACYRLHNKIMVQEILVISTAVHSTGRILKKISKLLRAF